MLDDDTVAGMVDNVLGTRLTELRAATGLPMAFGGAVRRSATGPHLRISRLVGNRSDALRGLRVVRGRGLGGTAMQRGVPCRVNDYATTTAITRDYEAFVARERLTSVLAVPVTVHGRIGGIIYAATRDTAPIGDVALRRANAIAATVERELGDLVGPVTVPYGHTPRSRAALDELATIAARTGDTALRADLVRIHRELAGPAAPRPGAQERVRLAPREVEVLRHVAVGASNLQIADAMALSPQTVKAYLRSATRRLGVRNRTAAVHEARGRGLI